MVNDTVVISDGDWLAVPDIVELTGASVSRVRSWLQDRDVVGLRRGANHAVMVPRTFFTEEGPVPMLRGTISVLGDSGLDDAEIIEWLHRPDESLPGGSPIASLRAGHKSEVRRRAQEEAF